MVLTYEEHANRIVIHVDKGRRDAWKKQPFYDQIKYWSEMATLNKGQVVVWQGTDAIAVLPDRDINLGQVRSDQLIVTSERQTPLGIERDVIVMDRDDPRLNGMDLPTDQNPNTTSG